MITLTLKSIEKINSTLEDWEGTLHSDGVVFNNNIIGGSNIECIKVLVDSDRYAFETHNGMYIASQWISKINNITLKKDTKLVGDKYIILKDMYLDINTLTFTPASEMLICDCCGDVSEHTTPNDGKLCSKCLVDKFYDIKSYSYKPTPTFFGKQIKADVDNPIHYGIELEYGFNSRTNMALLMMEHSKEVYLKSDSSIRGGEYKAELVTHPMSFEYLMSDAKWLDKLSSIEAIPNTDYNGCHVHISRSAFVDDKHYSLFYFMMHNMYDVLQYVGGRKFTDYCKPRASGKVFNKTKGNTSNANGDRAVMLNENNQATIEARFFASTDKAEDIKMYVQLLESVIKYTKYKTTVTVTGWVKYVQKYSIKYNFLNIKLGGVQKEWLDGNVTYKAPRMVTKDFSKVMASKLICISTIIMKDGTKYSDISNIRLDNGNSFIKVHHDGGNSSKELSWNEIAYCSWEE